MQEILVAIKCLVYNHEPYLRDCLEGFVMQQTNFPFVAIVHDDASTDGSAAIIREYEKKFPNIIKPIYETENQYSKRDGSLGRIMNTAIDATGAKYVAMCEGDDYWTDPLKLQRQVDFMEANPEYSMSTENGLVIYKDGYSWNFSEKETRDVSMEELLYQRQFPTASVLMRTELLRDVYKIEGPKFDTFIWTYMSQKGKIYYQNIVSSVYRRVDGVTERDKVKWAYMVELFNKNLYEKLNIPSYIIKKRNKVQVLDCYYGYKAAKEQKEYKVAYDLFLKCLHYDAFFFLKYLCINSKFYIQIVKFKSKLKRFSSKTYNNGN